MGHNKKNARNCLESLGYTVLDNQSNEAIMPVEKDGALLQAIILNDPELCYSSFVLDYVCAMFLPDKSGVRVYLPDIGLVRLEKLDRWERRYYRDYRIIKRAENNNCPYWTGSVLLEDLIGLTTVPKPRRKT